MMMDYHLRLFGGVPTRANNSFTVSGAMNDDSFAHHTGLFGGVPTRTDVSFTVPNAIDDDTFAYTQDCLGLCPNLKNRCFVYCQ